MKPDCGTERPHKKRKHDPKGDSDAQTLANCSDGGRFRGHDISGVCPNASESRIHQRGRWCDAAASGTGHARASARSSRPVQHCAVRRGSGRRPPAPRSPDVAKALRIEITYEEDFRRQLTIDWQRELVPPLNLAAIEHLRQTFAPLKRGDVVQIEYTPSKGATLRVNRAVVATGVNHDLMLAFLDHWLGQRPVSEELRRALTNRGS